MYQLEETFYFYFLIYYFLYIFPYCTNVGLSTGVPSSDQVDNSPPFEQSQYLLSKLEFCTIEIYNSVQIMVPNVI